MTYYIYHILGIKIGATINLQNRFKQNFYKYQIEPILVETIEGPDTLEIWQVVGDREWELADQYGYNRGRHYVDMRLKGIKPRTRKQLDQIHNAWANSSNGNNGKIGAPKLYKLTKEIADQIREEYNTTKTTHRKLATKYNISKQSIGRILRNQGYIV